MRKKCSIYIRGRPKISFLVDFGPDTDPEYLCIEPIVLEVPYPISSNVTNDYMYFLSVQSINKLNWKCKTVDSPCC